MSKAWSEGLEGGYVLKRDATAYCMQYTNLIHDKTLQATISGLWGSNGSTERVEVYAIISIFVLILSLFLAVHRRF